MKEAKNEASTQTNKPRRINRAESQRHPEAKTTGDVEERHGRLT